MTFTPLSSHRILSFASLDMEANIAREKYTRICANIAEQFRLLENQKNKRSEKELEIICDRLVKAMSPHNHEFDPQYNFSIWICMLIYEPFSRDRWSCWPRTRMREDL